MARYESLIKRFGKPKEAADPYCMLARGPCPRYEGYVPAACTVNIRVVCETSAETGGHGNVSLRRARACLKKKLQKEKEAASGKKTPPGS